MHTFYNKNARILAYIKKKLYICRLKTCPVAYAHETIAIHIRGSACQFGTGKRDDGMRIDER